MRLFISLALPCLALIVGCTSATPATPTSPPAPTTAPKPASSPAPSAAVAPSPSAAQSPAASPKPAVSPAASPSASPLAAGSPVALPQLMLSGTVTPGFSLQSTAFKDGDNLPAEYTCAVTGSVGSGSSPPLSWSGAPGNTRAFAVVVQDTDVPPPNGPFVHWVIYNIPGTLTSLAPAMAEVDALPNGAMQGINGRRALGYLGACPPPGGAAHHYVIQLFALDAPVTVKAQPTIVELASAMQGHVIAQTQLGAMFGR